VIPPKKGQKCLLGGHIIEKVEDYFNLFSTQVGFVEHLTLHQALEHWVMRKDKRTNKTEEATALLNLT
jgi:hypothetical protein